MACFKLTEHDAAWSQFGESQIFIGDVAHKANSSSMGVDYIRYDKGEANAWAVTYDEVLVILRGSFTVEFDGDAVTAGPGESIWLESGTAVVYRANEETLLVGVTYPVWRSTDGTKAQADVIHAVSSPAH